MNVGWTPPRMYCALGQLFLDDPAELETGVDRGSDGVGATKPGLALFAAPRGSRPSR